jgi:hypothetical protein
MGKASMQTKIRDWEHWTDPKLVSSMDEYWQGDAFQVHRQMVKDVLSSLFRREPECRTVLEFGSGTRNYVPMIRERGRKYVGADGTDAMRETGQQEISGHPLPDR